MPRMSAVLCCTVIIITSTSMSRLCYNAAASSAGLGGKARSLHHPLYLEKVSKDEERSRSSHQALSTLKPCVCIPDAVSLPPPAAVPIITACHCLSLSTVSLAACRCPCLEAKSSNPPPPPTLAGVIYSPLFLRPWADGLC